MKSKKRYACILLIVFHVSVGVGFAGNIHDIIQPVKIPAGQPDTILLNDMFYAKAYDLEFSPNGIIQVEFNKEQKKIVLTPRKDFLGAAFVEFSLEGTRYQIPVFVHGGISPLRPHTFRYKPLTTAETVYVTGSFNNWKKDQDQMFDQQGNGVFELPVLLEPGNYIYKFIVDGKPVIDPANPEKTPSGFDDFNSVLRIHETDTVSTFLHVGDWRESNTSISISYHYENSGDSSALQRPEVFALLDNQKVEERTLVLEKRTVHFSFEKKKLAGEKTLRVFAVRNGITTNIQQVILSNGIPAGSSDNEWLWYDASIYSIMIDRFSNGDKKNDAMVIHDSIYFPANYHGGDFQGIINKINEGYFDSLGVNTLWISPVNDNPNEAYREYPAPNRWYSGYHGYWPVSESQVEEKFGTMRTLKKLITAAHTHRMKVLLDIVAHHVHIRHPFYKNHPEWFGTLDLPDGRKNLRLWDEQRLTTWFEPYMPSFDFTKSGQAVRVVSDNAIWWLKETGADGFRHDAVKHVPNDFWRTLTRKLKEQIEIPQQKKVYQIGETFGEYDLIGSYVNNGQLSAQFNFNLSYFAIPVFLEPERSFAAVDFHLKRSFETFGFNNWMGNIMDSHDKVRYMAYADGKVKNQGIDTREMAWKNPPAVDHASSYKKAELYYAYMFTIPGLPIIYYGSEFGMTGVDDPDNRRMMRFGDELSFFEKRMLKETKKIVHMRKYHPALRYGDFYTMRADTAVYVYGRSDFNERLVVILNKSEQPQDISIKLPEVYHAQRLIDVQTEEIIEVQSNQIHAVLPPIAWRVLRIQ